MDDVGALSKSRGAPPASPDVRTSKNHGNFRSLNERILQTALFEAGGLALVCPVFSLVTGVQGSESVAILVALSLIEMLLSTIHNFVFDHLHLTWTGRIASDRTPAWRILHAVSYEIAATVVSLPVLMLAAGLSLAAALATDMALSILCTVYTYAFFAIYDRLRPLTRDTLTGPAQ
jgi:uncharacterized membrane protein